MSSLPYLVVVLILRFICFNSRDILKYGRLKKLGLILFSDRFCIVSIDY